MPVVSESVLAAKREAILTAAVAQFAQHGYAATEMETIAAAAGVAKGTLYRYFKSKEELFLAAVDRTFERLTEFVFEAIVCIDEPVAIVRTSFRAIARFLQRNPLVLELLAEERSVFRDRPPPAPLPPQQESPLFCRDRPSRDRAGSFSRRRPELGRANPGLPDARPDPRQPAGTQCRRARQTGRGRGRAGAARAVAGSRWMIDHSHACRPVDIRRDERLRAR
ncbi:MAG: TetR/AcrR family transcriptional regulator [Planctomycetaceae bacterium]|nr:TetR/AcrR family transcriptional regulator [Planctomycetaceae bacterium]